MKSEYMTPSVSRGTFSCLLIECCGSAGLLGLAGSGLGLSALTASAGFPGTAGLATDVGFAAAAGFAGMAGLWGCAGLSAGTGFTIAAGAAAAFFSVV